MFTLPNSRGRSRWQRRLSQSVIEKIAIVLLDDQGKLGQVRRRVLFKTLCHGIDRVMRRDHHPIYEALRLLQRVCPIRACTFVDNIMKIYPGIGYVELRGVDVLQNFPAVVVFGKVLDDRSLGRAGVCILAILEGDNPMRSDKHALKDDHPQQNQLPHFR